jgi:hypothetical protein
MFEKRIVLHMRMGAAHAWHFTNVGQMCMSATLKIRSSMEEFVSIIVCEKHKTP